MSGPRFDEIEGEEETAPSFDAIEGAEETPAPPQIAPNGPVLRAPAQSTWNTLRSVAEASGTVPRGIIPDEGTARGAMASALQGPTFNWADEVAGLLAVNKSDSERLRSGGNMAPHEQAAIYARAKAYVAGGMPFSDALQRAAGDVRSIGGTTYREGRDAFRNVEGAFRKENPAAAFALTAGSGAALAPTPRGMDAPDFITRYASALLPGAVAGAGAADESEDMAQAAAVGAPMSAGGQALGEAFGDVVGGTIGAVGRGAQSRVNAAEERAREMAAEKVAAEVRSAKSALGSRTQEANRFVENLLRLESTGAMTGEQASQLAALRQNGVLPALEHKLAESMLEEVPGAAGRIDIARAAYEGLAENAPAATEEAAADILSGSEAKRQVMERVKRYLPTAIGAIAGADKKGALGGALAGYALGGTPGSALIGGLSMSALRPAMRAVGRMAQHPAVQRGMFSPVAGAAGPTSELVSELFESAGPAVSNAMRNAVEARTRGDTSTSDTVQLLMSSNPEALGPYAQQLQQAAADGNLPLVHYTLQQTDPNYRRMLDSLRPGGTQ